jgi:hypothetical protein
LFRKKPVQLQIVRQHESKLRLAEWRNDPRLCSMAAKILADPNLQLMLSVMKNEHPARTALPYGVSLDDRAVLQARCEGYEMFLSTLESLAVNIAAVPMPEAAFEPEVV